LQDKSKKNMKKGRNGIKRIYSQTFEKKICKRKRKMLKYRSPSYSVGLYVYKEAYRIVWRKVEE
jgi:hypothetical protein